MSKELTPLEALKQMSAYHLEMGVAVKDLPNYEIIEKELILSNALENKINRQIEMKQYRHEASNSYHIDALLTYELKERWDDMELEALTQLLLNLSGISKKLKALELIKEKRVNVRAFLKCCHTEDGLTIYNSQCNDEKERESKELTQEEYDLLKEVLIN